MGIRRRPVGLYCHAVAAAVLVLCLAVTVALAEEPAGKGEDAAVPEGKLSTSESVMNAISIMLIGSITFQMSLFYLVNHSDSDIRYYSWLIIGTTVSIFVAVLFYQALTAVVEKWFIKHHGEIVEGREIPVHFAHMCFWFVALQVLTAKLAGKNFSDFTALLKKSPGKAALLEKKEEEDAELTEEDKKEEEEQNEKRELNLQCFAGMTAHVTGFAAITAWGDMQHLEFFAMNPFTAMFAVVVTFFGLMSFFWVTEKIRNKVIYADSIVDECEEMWDDEAKEAENDVIGLACSFLIMQANRFYLVGHLPNVEGAMLGAPSVMGHEVKMLSVLLLFWVVCGCGIYHVNRKYKLKDGKTQKARYVYRFVLMCQQVAFMSVSWTIMFVFKAGLRSTGLFYNGGDESVVAQVALALMVSLFLLLIVFMLDKIADSDASEKDTDKIIEKIIIAMGLTIGFCWEKCFDAAVENLAERSEVIVGEQYTWECKFFGAVLVCAWVTPAYRWYILPAVAKCKAAKKGEDESKWTEKKNWRAVSNFEHVHIHKNPKTPPQNWDTHTEQEKLAHNVMEEHRKDWTKMNQTEKLAHLDSTDQKVKGWSKINTKSEIEKHNSTGPRQALLA